MISVIIKIIVILQVLYHNNDDISNNKDKNNFSSAPLETNGTINKSSRP